MRIRSRRLVSLSAGIFAAVLWLLVRTIRLSLREETPGANPYVKSPTERFLFCVWHDSMVMAVFGGKQHSSAALTSRHVDGSFVADVLRWVGVSTIRGSTNHIGSGAMRQLMRATEDKHLGITPDGPRGPRRRMSVGIAFLASRTGCAVVPTAYSCVRCWTVRGSWTDLVIPKPFTKVFLLGGKPIKVPPDLEYSQLQQYVDRIQAEMDRLNTAAELLSATARSGQSCHAESDGQPSHHNPYERNGE